MSFSAHLPVLLPQRESDQLAPEPWPSASISLLTSTPSFLASVKHSKLATMQDHSSMLLTLLVICPAPTSPTWSTCLLKAWIAGRALATAASSPPTHATPCPLSSASWPSTSGTSTMPMPFGAASFARLRQGSGEQEE